MEKVRLASYPLYIWITPPFPSLPLYLLISLLLVVSSLPLSSLFIEKKRHCRRKRGKLSPLYLDNSSFSLSSFVSSYITTTGGLFSSFIFFFIYRIEEVLLKEKKKAIPFFIISTPSLPSPLHFSGRLRFSPQKES